jgi:hypothetical protein
LESVELRTASVVSRTRRTKMQKPLFTLKPQKIDFLFTLFVIANVELVISENVAWRILKKNI